MIYVVTYKDFTSLGNTGKMHTRKVHGNENLLKLLTNILDDWTVTILVSVRQDNLVDPEISDG